jgi:drug/metabolite transporter (DMT)-like permease
LTSAPSWLRWAPVFFVFLWSTGFIGSRLGAPYAEPFTFLLWRFVIATLLLAAVCVLWRTRRPSSARLVLHSAVAGLMVHGMYLGGVFYAIRNQLPVGLAALIVGMQPLITATLAGPLLGERVSARQWFGFALGFAGVVVFVAARYGLTFDIGAQVAGFISCTVALVGITAGTIYQKRFCSDMPLAAGGVVQYAACALVYLPIAAFTETMHVEWTGEFIFALAWLVLVLSVAAIGLLYTMIRHGESARVASFFFLTPPVTAVMAWLLFGEAVTPVAWIGLALTAVGVALVTRR